MHTDTPKFFQNLLFSSPSFGQDAIFLLGGPTKATKPTPILLRSGDICVMSGPARLAYHAVPRILRPAEPALPDCFDLSKEDLVGLLGRSDRNRKGPGDCCEQICNCHKAWVPSVREKDSSVATENTAEEKCVNCCQCNCEHAEFPCTCSQREQNHEVSSSQHDSHTSDASASSKSSKKDSSWEMKDTSSNMSDTKHSFSDKSEQTSPKVALVKEVNDRIVCTLPGLEWEPFSAYLSSSRLNVNIRQVLKPGQTFQGHVQMEDGQSTSLCAEKES